MERKLTGVIMAQVSFRSMERKLTGVIMAQVSFRSSQILRLLAATS